MPKEIVIVGVVKNVETNRADCEFIDVAVPNELIPQRFKGEFSPDSKQNGSLLHLVLEKQGSNPVFDKGQVVKIDFPARKKFGKVKIERIELG